MNEEIKKEIERLIGRAFRDREREGSFDMEELEGATKEAMLRCGAIMLKHVLKVEDGAALGRPRSRGGKFRREGLFIGSGVVEAGCKSLIGQRLKQSGMRWSARGANSSIAPRRCLESGYFEDYWESRQSA